MVTTAVSKDKLSKPQQQSLQKYVDQQRGLLSMQRCVTLIKKNMTCAVNYLQT